MNFDYLEEQGNIIKNLIDTESNIQFNYDKLTKISNLSTDVIVDTRKTYPKATNKAIKKWQKEKDLHKYLFYFCEAFLINFDELDNELTELIEYIYSEKDDYIKLVKNEYIESYIDQLLNDNSESGKMNFLIKVLKKGLINIESEYSYISRRWKPKIKIENYNKIISISNVLQEALFLYVIDFVSDFSSQIIYMYLMLNDCFVIDNGEDMGKFFSFTEIWMRYYYDRLSKSSRENVLTFLNKDFYKLFQYCCELFPYEEYGDINYDFFTNQFYVFFLKVIQSNIFSQEEKREFIENYIIKMITISLGEDLYIKFIKDIKFDKEIHEWFKNI